MPNVPQIVRERLKAAMPVGEHPDANVLTAFSEQSLPANERATVLEHLARCGDCRDIVALALPAMEEAGAAVVVPRRGWLTWPTLRWGVVAAGVVVIASFGVLSYRQSLRRAMMPSSATPRLEVAKEVPVQPPAAETAQTAPPTARGDESRTTREFADSLEKNAREEKLIAPATRSQTGADVAPPVVGAAAGAAFGQRSHGPGPKMPAMQWQVQNNNQVQNNKMQLQVPATDMPSAGAKPQDAQPTTVNVPQASETVEVTSQSPVVTTESQVQGSLRDESARQQSSDDDTLTSVGKAKGATTRRAAGAAAPPPAPPSPTLAKGRLAAVGGPNAERLPRWTISSSGALQRSFDQGNTWQDVDVSAVPVLGANDSSLEVVTKTSRAKEEKDADKKALKQQALTFRAVSALGADVWAGGSGGVLYHSQDSGLHWSRVVPSSAGVILTGDIVSLEFTDPQHGKIMTSVSEIWTTSNNGQTWQKQ